MRKLQQIVHFLKALDLAKKTENVQIPVKGVCAKFLRKNCIEKLNF